MKKRNIDFNDPNVIGKDWGSKPFQHSWFTLSPIILYIIVVISMLLYFF
jgi:hypothetical protein